MHSSRMRTARAFTVYQNVFPGDEVGGCTCLVRGGYLVQGVCTCLVGGEVYLPGPGGGTCLVVGGGVPGPGGCTWSRRCTCLVPGGCTWFQGGTCLVRGVPGQLLPPRWTEWHTLLRILPSPKLCLRVVKTENIHQRKCFAFTFTWSEHILTVKSHLRFIRHELLCELFTK